MTEKMQYWQERAGDAEAAYADKASLIDGRETLYIGSRDIAPLVLNDKTTYAPHIRNVVAEMIESQIDAAIPAPKVTPCRKQDERLAKIIEDMLRNELDRLNFEMYNDMQERTVPIQGGGFWLVEWDNSQKSATENGQLNVSVIHPKQVAPQDGVYTGIEDMDYIILKLPQTKEYIRRNYNVDVSDESEEKPEVKTTDERAAPADDIVTQYIAYYRNNDGGIGMYSWVGNVELADYDDYQARRLKRCKACGEVMDGSTCPQCGAKDYESKTEDTELIPPEAMGPQAQQTVPGMMQYGNVFNMQRVPYYKPDIYPIIMQKNVSVFGQFLGDSDADKIADQQNTINRIEAKIIDKLVKSGSYISLPADASICVDTDDAKVIRLTSAADKTMIDVYDLQGDVSADMAYLTNVYEEARQAIGITDSYQGRVDTTATSGKAKQFAAQQSAGRLQSKRVQKQAAYALLFEAMFKFKLAYADEPRPVVSKDPRGNIKYDTFNRWDFLARDEGGNLLYGADGMPYWNDKFLFSCDIPTPLASDRTTMWQETRQNLQSGAFGDPANIDTLILFWSKMESLHYPDATETKMFLEQQKQAQIQQQQQQAAMQQAQMQAQAQTQQQQMAFQQRQNEQQSEQQHQTEAMKAIQQARHDALDTAIKMKSLRGGENRG